MQSSFPPGSIGPDQDSGQSGSDSDSARTASGTDQGQDPSGSRKWGPQGTGRFAAGTRPPFGAASQDGAADYRSVQQTAGADGQPGASSQGAAAQSTPGGMEPSAPVPGAAPPSGWELPPGLTESAPDASVWQDEMNALRAELEAARKESGAHREAWLRANAETENVRRRAQDEVAKAHKYGIEGFAEGLVPVIDSLEMALKVENVTPEKLREGVETTLRQLVQVFDKNRLTAINPLNEKFDPNMHQAISMAPSPDVPANHVLAVLQKGYRINDRVLRPALVTVSQGG